MEDKEIKEESEYSEIDKLVSDTAVSLVKENKAKWQYLNEGKNNIAVLFVVTDQNISDRYMKGLEIIKNKVFRILKYYKVSSLFSSTKEQVNYLNLFMDYVVKGSESKDPELYKFTLDFQNIKMTQELLKSISDGIEESRKLHIENFQREFGTTKFSDINKELRFAKIMDNMSSFGSTETKGVVKHITLNLQNMIPVVLGHSYSNYLNENFSKEEINHIQKELKVSKFTMKEVSKFTKNINSSISEYNPLEILSDDNEIMKDCVKKYFRSGDNRNKLYKNGSASKITDQDIDTISEFLQGGIIKLAEKYQKICNYDLGYIEEIYTELMEADDSPQESVANYFKTFFETHFNQDENTTLTLLQSKWKILMDYFISDLLKEVIIKWVEYEETEGTIYDSEQNKVIRLIGIKIIDLDTKPYTNIPRYRKRFFDVFKNYVRYQVDGMEVKATI